MKHLSFGAVKFSSRSCLAQLLISGVKWLADEEMAEADRLDQVDVKRLRSLGRSPGFAMSAALHSLGMQKQVRCGPLPAFFYWRFSSVMLQSVDGEVGEYVCGTGGDDRGGVGLECVDDGYALHVDA